MTNYRVQLHTDVQLPGTVTHWCTHTDIDVCVVLFSFQPIAIVNMAPEYPKI